jgi:hypothetical protein
MCCGAITPQTLPENWLPCPFRGKNFQNYGFTW